MPSLRENTPHKKSERHFVTAVNRIPAMPMPHRITASAVKLKPLRAFLPYHAPRMNGDKYIVVSSQRDPSVSAPKMDDCYMTGVVIRVRQVVKKNEDYVRILVVAESRIRISEIYQTIRSPSVQKERVEKSSKNRSQPVFRSRMSRISQPAPPSTR